MVFESGKMDRLLHLERKVDDRFWSTSGACLPNGLNFRNYLNFLRKLLMYVSMSLIKESIVFSSLEQLSRLLFYVIL